MCVYKHLLIDKYLKVYIDRDFKPCMYINLSINALTP